LKRLGIVKAGDGKYYRAPPASGGAILLRPVDPNIAAAAVKTGLDISSTISEAATEQYKLHVMAIARKVAQNQASSSCSCSHPTPEAHQPHKEKKPLRARITQEYMDKPLSNK
jgi:hypothetical protein